MNSERANEQVIEMGKDTILFLLEGIGGILGSSNISSQEEGIIETKLNQVMSSFLNDKPNQIYGESSLGDLKKTLNLENKDIDKIKLSSEKLPDFQKVANREKLNYSISTVNTSEKDITIISFPKDEINKMMKICLNIADKSLEKGKIPVKKKVEKAKKEQQKKTKEKSRNRAKNKYMER